MTSLSFQARSLAFGTAVLVLMSGQLLPAADFSVVSPGFSYSINNKPNNPTLTLERGKTYTFAISTDISHPFQILSGGAVNNNINSGTITYNVPMAVSNYTYRCSVHGFFGTIITVPPVAPPVVQILSLSVSTNLVLKSTGTNNWSVLPEFNTNLTTTNWFALTVQSNRFTTGTNDTICGRPPGTNVFIRMRNTKNPPL